MTELIKKKKTLRLPAGQAPPPGWIPVRLIEYSEDESDDYSTAEEEEDESEDESESEDYSTAEEEEEEEVEEQEEEEEEVEDDEDEEVEEEDEDDAETAAASDTSDFGQSESVFVTPRRQPAERLAPEAPIKAPMPDYLVQARAAAMEKLTENQRSDMRKIAKYSNDKGLSAGEVGNQPDLQSELFEPAVETLAKYANYRKEWLDNNPEQEQKEEPIEEQKYPAPLVEPRPVGWGEELDPNPPGYAKATGVQRKRTIKTEPGLTLIPDDQLPSRDKAGRDVLMNEWKVVSDKLKEKESPENAQEALAVLSKAYYWNAQYGVGAKVPTLNLTGSGAIKGDERTYSSTRSTIVGLAAKMRRIATIQKK